MRDRYFKSTSVNMFTSCQHGITAVKRNTSSTLQPPEAWKGLKLAFFSGYVSCSVGVFEADTTDSNGNRDSPEMSYQKCAQRHVQHNPLLCCRSICSVCSKQSGLSPNKSVKLLLLAERQRNECLLNARTSCSLETFAWILSVNHCWDLAGSAQQRSLFVIPADPVNR